MNSRITSAILTRTSSMKRTIPGLKKTIHTTFGSDSGYEMNQYIHKDFFDGENYQSILKCLDEGYEIATDLIEYMQDFCNLLRDFIESLTSYSNKWKAKIKHQSTLSSYNTTKQAQLQTVTAPVKLAQLIETRCKAIQEVIASYKRQIDRMYPGERFGTVHKHYRTDVMKKSFKNAYSSLSKISDKLDKLREQEKRAQDALLQAQIECQNLELNETSSKSKILKANDRLEQRQGELETIKEKLTRTEDEYHQEQKTYHQKALEIYHDCRDLEAERLNQIRETLLAFNQAIHTSEYSAEQNAMYEKVVSTIESQQKTVVDLDFWAQTYHVNTLSRSISLETSENDDKEENSESQSTTRKTRKSQKNETTNLTTIVENTTQPVAEPEEDQSVADKPTTQAKGKQKKKKNNTAEPTTPDQV